MDTPTGALVLGLGNVLMGDDGVGVRAVERLQARYVVPAQIDLLDGGTKGLELLSYVEGSSHLLVLDAVNSDLAPGELVRLVDDEIPVALGRPVSMHEAGLLDLLLAAALQGVQPRRTVLHGVVPARIEWGIDLSPVVAGCLDQLVDAAVAELRSWGFTLAEEGNER